MVGSWEDKRHIPVVEATDLEKCWMRGLGERDAEQGSQARNPGG